ncbi:hypothetical protein KHU12_26220, partial [Pseudocitrobacter faecalis]
MSFSDELYTLKSYGGGLFNNINVFLHKGFIQRHTRHITMFSQKKFIPALLLIAPLFATATHAEVQ